MEDKRKRIGSIDYSDSVLLVSGSMELAGDLGDVINGTRTSVEDLPVHTAVKAVVLDADIAKQGRFPPSIANFLHIDPVEIYDSDPNR